MAFLGQRSALALVEVLEVAKVRQVADIPGRDLHQPAVDASAGQAEQAAVEFASVQV